MDDKAIDPIRKARRIGDSNHCAARESKEFETMETSRLDDGLEILDKSIEGEFDAVPIRQAASALVEPDQRVMSSQ